MDLPQNLFDISVTTLQGQNQQMSDYKGKVLLITNTAEKCKFTPQYKDLEEIYQKYKEKGLLVLGFPCNQFGNQSPGSESDIQSFCELNYQTTFPMFKKVDVNGNDAHPLFTFLKKKAPGILGTEAVKWNFTKFLVDRDGNVTDRFAPQTTGKSLEKEIEKIL